MTTTPVSQYFDELEIGPVMAQNQIGRRARRQVAIFESSVPDEPAISHELRTTSPNTHTTNIPASIDSATLCFRTTKRKSNKLAEFLGNGFVVTFQNYTTKRVSCNCSNAVPCLVRIMEFAIILHNL